MTTRQHERETVQTGVRLPLDLWKRVRHVSFALGIAAQSVVRDALAAYLPKLEARAKKEEPGAIMKRQEKRAARLEKIARRT